MCYYARSETSLATVDRNVLDWLDRRLLPPFSFQLFPGVFRPLMNYVDSFFTT